MNCNIKVVEHHQRPMRFDDGQLFGIDRRQTVVELLSAEPLATKL